MMGLFKRTSELVDFQRGTEHWRYTLDARNAVYQTKTYIHVPGMQRGKLQRTADPEQAQLELTVPMDLDVVGLFIPRPTTARVTLRLLWLKKGESTARVRWIGNVAVVKCTSATRAVITCLPDSADAAANGLTRNWQKQCPLRLYSAGLGQCNASPDSRRINGTVTASTGVTVKAAAWAARDIDDFAGGYIQWQVGPSIERRYVTASAGDTLSLLTPADIPIGTAVAAYSGCDHTIGGGCTKFANTDNYGGQPNIPLKNPMGSDPIF